MGEFLPGFPGRLLGVNSELPGPPRFRRGERLPPATPDRPGEWICPAITDRAWSPQFYAPAVRPNPLQRREAPRPRGAPASYWLLLAFLFLLYANLPFVLPATEVLRPAKVVAGAALVMLLAETLLGRRTLCFRLARRVAPAGLCGCCRSFMPDRIVAAPGGRVALRPGEDGPRLFLYCQLREYRAPPAGRHVDSRDRRADTGCGHVEELLTGKLSRRHGPPGWESLPIPTRWLTAWSSCCLWRRFWRRPWSAAAPGAAGDLDCLYRRNLCHLLARWAGGVGSGGRALRLAEAKTIWSAAALLAWRRPQL